MSNKDFLSQFSGGSKPDSFKEEIRTPIYKNRKPVNIKLLVIILISILAIAGIILFIMFRPTIEVKDFVGQSSSEVTAWIRQNDIDIKGVIFREEYNFDYDENIIIYQSVEDGKRIRKDTKLDFTVSKGADPDEKISLPDIKSMTKSEIQDWISKNKLTKTKITTTYDEEVLEGNVISYELKNVEESDFTRSSTLNITISKGPKPAGVVVVNDFVGKYYAEVENWATTNKVKVNKVETYSETVDIDKVISQSIEGKKEMKEGETLTVYVSLGKGVKVPDFSVMTKEQVESWMEENPGYFKKKEIYSTSLSYVVSQSIPAGKYIGADKKVELTLSLGSNFYLDEIGFNIVGNSYDKFKDYALELEGKGLYIDTHKTWVDSEKTYGTIIGIDKITSENQTYSELQRLPLKVDVYCFVSNNKKENIWLDSEYTDSATSTTYRWISINTEAEAKKICELATIDENNVVVVKEKSPYYEANNVISITCNGKNIEGREFISKNDIVVITICEEKIPLE